MKVILRYNKDICAVLGFYATYNGSFLPTFRENLSGPSSRFKQSKNSLTHEDGTDRLFRNVGKKLPFYAA